MGLTGEMEIGFSPDAEMGIGKVSWIGRDGFDWGDGDWVFTRRRTEMEMAMEMGLGGFVKRNGVEPQL